VKNCLAVFGMLFLLVFVVSAVLLAPVYLPVLQESGLVAGLLDILAGPGEVLVGGTPAAPGQPQAAPPLPGGQSSPTVTNLVEPPSLPLPTAQPTRLPPTPTPTPTPIPVPEEYRTRVMIRARHFSTALDIFLNINQRLDGDPNLLEDRAWRSEVTAALDEFVLAALAMGAVEPVPPEYAQVDEWLDRAGAEARILRDHYRAGIETGNRQYFEAVAASLNKIVEHMAQAQQAMIAAGWP
jgi:hypothetical protein